MKRLILLLALGLFQFQLSAQTQIQFYTTMGDFVVEMSDSLTPITSGNFIDLVNDEYYDGVIFHRVIDNFMIQGGDPTGTGSGGPGYTIQDEFDSTGTLSNIQKTISMANTGAPNSGGSQFFINLVNNTYLDFDKPPYSSKHPVFGMVVDSFEVVQAIGDVPVNGSNRPLTDVVMDSLRVIIIDTVPTDTVDTIPAGATEISHSANVRIYPNPVNELSVLFFESVSASSGSVSIIDQQGRVVFEQRRTFRNGMNRMADFGQPLNALPVGMYMLRIETESAFHQEKFMVVK